MEKIIFYILIFALGFIVGTMFTIRTQRIDAVILKNGEGTTTISIDFLGQIWNYTTKNGTLESIND